MKLPLSHMCRQRVSPAGCRPVAVTCRVLQSFGPQLRPSEFDHYQASQVTVLWNLSPVFISIAFPKILMSTGQGRWPEIFFFCVMNCTDAALEIAIATWETSSVQETSNITVCSLKVGFLVWMKTGEEALRGSSLYHWVALLSECYRYCSHASMTYKAATAEVCHNTVRCSLASLKWFSIEHMPCSIPSCHAGDICPGSGQAWLWNVGALSFLHLSV